MRNSSDRTGCNNKATKLRLVAVFEIITAVMTFIFQFLATKVGSEFRLTGIHQAGTGLWGGGLFLLNAFLTAHQSRIIPVESLNRKSISYLCFIISNLSCATLAVIVVFLLGTQSEDYKDITVAQNTGCSFIMDSKVAIPLYTNMPYLRAFSNALLLAFSSQILLTIYSIVNACSYSQERSPFTDLCYSMIVRLKIRKIYFVSKLGSDNHEPEQKFCSHSNE